VVGRALLLTTERYAALVVSDGLGAAMKRQGSNFGRDQFININGVRLNVIIKRVAREDDLAVFDGNSADSLGLREGEF